jgi:tRNA(adenine34) deaminase
MNDGHHLRIAISRSKESAAKGNFPAGAAMFVDYKGNEVQYSSISGNETDFRHAEVRVIEDVVSQVVSETNQKLTGSTLYASMEPCLMCLTTAYWAGIRRIIYAIPKSKLKPEYYESSLSTSDINNKLLERIELIHLAELEDQALSIVRECEAK